jgi:hypothetical protein
MYHLNHVGPVGKSVRVDFINFQGDRKRWVNCKSDQCKERSVVTLNMCNTWKNPTSIMPPSTPQATK